eukprot:scaffold12244_cov216-Isochrysis_galbana.AAC.2
MRCREAAQAAAHPEKRIIAVRQAVVLALAHPSARSHLSTNQVSDSCRTAAYMPCAASAPRPSSGHRRRSVDEYGRCEHNVETRAWRKIRQGRIRAPDLHTRTGSRTYLLFGPCWF